MDVRQCSGLPALHERERIKTGRNIAYWAEVLEMRMKSGGIGQNGGRGSKSDCEICKRVVVVLEVEGHDLSDLD